MKSISSFRGDCKMTVWLCQIAKHLYFAQKRREKHSAIMTLDEVSDHLPDTTSQPLELRIADETDAMCILEYLHDIEEPYKEVFMLRVFGELSFKKIWDEVAIRKAFIVKSFSKPPRLRGLTS